MNEDIINIHPKPIQNNRYAYWFQEVRYNGTTLSDDERKEIPELIIYMFIAVMAVDLPHSWIRRENLSSASQRNIRNSTLGPIPFCTFLQGI